MAIKLITTYAKRLGLPGYSSHQFSVTCETELTDLSAVPDQSARLYALLQESVDREMQQTGFVPDYDYGEVPPTNGPINGNVHHHAQTPAAPRPWQCSDKQRELISELAGELHLDDDAIDQRSLRLFKRPAHHLSKLAASGLISDLLAEAGSQRVRQGGIGHSKAHGNGNGNGNGNDTGHGGSSRRVERQPVAAPGRRGGAA